jgi:hypothetical protein
MHKTKEKIKEKTKQRTVAVLKHSPHQRSNHHLIQHPDYKRVSPKVTSARRNNAQALLSPDRRSWVFTLEKVRVPKTMTSAKPL